MKYLPQTLALLVLSVFLRADSWSTGGIQPAPGSAASNWEQTPAGGDDPGLLDSYIQDLKWEVRRRLEVEVDFGPVSGDSGVMREGSARAFVTPTDTSAVDELSDQDDSGSDSPGPYVPASETNSSDLLTFSPWGTQGLGVGRLLVSTGGPTAQVADPSSTTDDDGKLYWHNGTVWLEAKAQHDDISELSRQKSGARNQIKCGSFECMANGDVGPMTAYGWAALGTPTTSTYVPALVANDEGLMYRTVGNDAANPEGQSITLRGLRPATVYAIRARAFATAAGDVCRLRVTGDATITDNTTSNGVWENLQISYTTGAAPADAVVSIGAMAAGGSDQCDFDRVAIYEESFLNLPSPNPVTKYVQNPTPVSLVSPAFTTIASLPIAIPTDNFVVRVNGNVCAGLDGAGTNAIFQVRLFNGASAVAVTQGMLDTAGAGGRGYTTVPIEFVDLNPTSGATTTYSLQATELVNDTEANDDDEGAGTCISSLTVQMLPN